MTAREGEGISFAEFCERLAVTKDERKKLVVYLAVFRAMATIEELSVQP